MAWTKWLDPGFYEIRQLKNDEATGPFVENNPHGYRIQVIRRGEALLYIQGQRATLIAIDIRADKIFSDSVRAWDDDALLTETEKRIVLERAVSYMERYQHVKAVVV